MLSRVGGRCQGIGAAVLAAALLLSGCSDAGDPAPTDAPTGSAGDDGATEPASTASEPAESDEPTVEVPVPSPRPEPERPAAMDDTGEKGAVAAAEYFFELYNYATTTGDVGGLEDMSHEACGSCERLAVRVAEVYERGDWIVGAAADITITDVAPTIDGLATEVTFDFAVDPGRIHSDNGEIEALSPVNEIGARLVIQRFDDWKVVGRYAGTESS